MSISTHSTKRENRYRVPIDPDDERWIYKSFALLDDSASVDSVEVILENCEIVEALMSFGTVTTYEDETAENTWGVKIAPLTGVNYCRVTWRCQTAISGDTALGDQFDRTDWIPVRTL